MNGYKVLADAHRKAGQEHEADLLDFIGNCSPDDICFLFDSTAFNDIARAYVRRAVSELQDDKTLTSEQAEAVRARHSGLFDEMQAKQVIS